MPIFGMPTLIELNTVAEHAALCGQLGLGFVELNTNFPNQQLHLLDADALNALAQAHSIFYTIHLNDEMPVADFNPTVADGYLRATLEAIELAKKIGARVINMHISEGAHYTRPDGIVYFYEAYLADYLGRIAAFRDACTRAIGSSGICICMENSKAYLPFQRRALDVLLQSPAFQLTLDVGHNHCSGYADEGWILERRSRLQHMHIHDARGNQDHLPLGRGDIALDKYFELGKGQCATVLLEVKTVEGLKNSVRWLREAGLYEN